MDMDIDKLDYVSRYKQNVNLPEYLSGKPRFVLRFDYTPSIQTSDIDKGTITRYFGRKINEPTGEILEINETFYNNLKNTNLYIVVKLIWRIRGKIEDVYIGTIRTYTGVVSANILSILEAQKQLPGVMSKLPDPLQYYQKE